MAPKRKSTRANPNSEEAAAQTNSAEIARQVAEQVAAAIAAYEVNRNSHAGNERSSSQNEGPAGGSTARGCSYKEFLNCKPLTFNGTEGAVGLIRWFEKLESVFRISGCTDNNRVKYATCTLLNSALTWWNAYAQSMGIDAAYETPWETLKEMMRAEYCPRNEMQKLEVEFWNLTVKGTNLAAYTNRFHELALLCPMMVTPEFKKVERYIWGLSPQIQGLVTSSKPITIQEAIRMAHDLMDQVIRQGTMAKSVEVRNNDGKRKWEGNQGRNFEQQMGKRPETVRNYAVGSKDRRSYNGNYLYCNQCNRHHPGRCNNNCERCNKPGHQAKDCRSFAPVSNDKAPGSCYECGNMGHIKRDCPKLKNYNTGRTDGRTL